MTMFEIFQKFQNPNKFKIAPKIQIFSTNFKISKQIQNLPKILKKIKQNSKEISKIRKKF